MKKLKTFFFLSLFLFSACATEQTGNNSGAASATPPPESKKTAPDDLKKAMRAIEPFFKPMGEPEPHEWLATFKEGGQTFEEYINFNPTLPTGVRKKLYVQPIGNFTPAQRRLINQTVDYMAGFFNLPVEILKEKKFAHPLRLKDSRTHREWKIKQVRTGYVMDEILIPALPADAAALIAFTNEDLYPDETMNFVFGQANLERRVGVWSLYRLDDDANAKSFLERTMKIAVHETGHMFSMLHCTKFECVMSGSNHLQETDKHPLDACSECMAKICWMTGIKPEKRFENLARICRTNGLAEEAAVFEQKSEAVRKSYGSSL